MLGEELFCGCEELEAVLGFGETVSFVGEKHVLVGDALDARCESLNAFVLRQDLCMIEGKV